MLALLQGPRDLEGLDRSDRWCHRGVRLGGEPHRRHPGHRHRAALRLAAGVPGGAHRADRAAAEAPADAPGALQAHRHDGHRLPHPHVVLPALLHRDDGLFHDVGGICESHHSGHE